MNTKLDFLHASIRFMNTEGCEAGVAMGQMVDLLKDYEEKVLAPVTHRVLAHYGFLINPNRSSAYNRTWELHGNRAFWIDEAIAPEGTFFVRIGSHKKYIVSVADLEDIISLWS